MSIFGSIMTKVFGHKDAAAATAPQPAQSGAMPVSAAPAAAQTTADVAATPASPAQEAKPAAMAAVDVEAVLTDMAGRNPQKLDWRHSIVDLMKLLNIDSSLGARRELAGELGYSGSMDDSAAMNVWLHKQVMAKLAENGGKVPDELRG